MRNKESKDCQDKKDYKDQNQENFTLLKIHIKAYQVHLKHHPNEVN
jgi:hypothetical protein